MKYGKDEWEKALEAAEGADWCPTDMDEAGNRLGVELLRFYEGDKVGRDEQVLLAALDAAEVQFDDWDALDLERVVDSYTGQSFGDSSGNDHHEIRVYIEHIKTTYAFNRVRP